MNLGSGGGRGGRIIGGAGYCRTTCGGGGGAGRPAGG